MHPVREGVSGTNESRVICRTSCQRANQREEVQKRRDHERDENTETAPEHGNQGGCRWSWLWLVYPKPPEPIRGRDATAPGKELTLSSQKLAGGILQLVSC